jgi:hypothetical protein
MYVVGLKRDATRIYNKFVLIVYRFTEVLYISSLENEYCEVHQSLWFSQLIKYPPIDVIY